MGQKFRINRDFLRTIVATGKYQNYTCSEQKGFAIKVSPTGRISYTYRWVAPGGKQCRRTIGYFPEMQPTQARELTRKFANSEEHNRDTDVDRLEKKRKKQEIKVATQTLTLREFIEGDYGRWMIANQKRGDQMKARALRVTGDQLLDTPILDITLKMMDEWFMDRCMTVTSGTAAREATTIKAAINKAVRWKLVSENPIAEFRPKFEDNQIIRFLSGDEEKALRSALDAREQHDRETRRTANQWREERHYELLPDLTTLPFTDYLKPAVLLAMNTGLRRTEMLLLEWVDIDFSNANLTIRNVNAKWGKGRHIPLNREALSILSKWKTMAHKRYVFAGSDDKPLTDIKKPWTHLLKAADITNFRWHDLRHHFASSLVMAGVDLNTVRELMGHSDLKMTLRYAHLAPEHKAAAVAKLNKDYYEQTT